VWLASLSTARCNLTGPFGSDSDLRRHGEKIASRGAKNAKKRAVVAVSRKLSVLLHRLWVSAEVYEPLRNTHRRQEQEEGGSVEERRWRTAKHTQEVKILVHSGEATLKWRMATAELARTRFGSSIRRLRYCELGLPFQEGRSEDCSAFGSKRRISSYAPSYQKERAPRE
jgi:hypothetical protein